VQAYNTLEYDENEDEEILLGSRCGSLGIGGARFSRKIQPWYSIEKKKTRERHRARITMTRDLLSA